MTDPQQAVSAALRQFEELHPDEISLSLERIGNLLETLGRPQAHLPPTIHVAGTNGKGSTCAFMRAIAEAAGLKVHVFTSPHLVRFNERIRLAGALVEDGPLTDWLNRTYAALQGQEITHFEATTAAAILAFSEVPADLLILEVGLGGRFDATNVIDMPALSVITPIDYDHTGLQTAVWPARLQQLGPGPLTHQARDIPIWLDGGHNPHAAAAISEQLQSWGGRTIMITAMMASKDHAGYFAPFKDCVAEVHTCPNAPGHRGAAPTDLADTVRHFIPAAKAHRDFDTAFQAALAARPDRILISGSLYLAGEVLALNEDCPG